MTVTASSRSPASLWMFIVFVVLTYFTLGAGYLESFVNYPLWHIIGPGESWPSIIALSDLASSSCSRCLCW